MYHNILIHIYSCNAAAALASRVYYHLEDLHDSLRLALGAGKYFDVTSRLVIS